LGGYERLYPPVPMDPAEYEIEVTRLFKQISPNVSELRVTHQDKIGPWKFDFTIRYELGGMKFLVCGEAKRHSSPIEKDVVAYLHYRTQDIGGHKGIVVATAPFQSGARHEATKHGIALVQFVDGRATYETRARGQRRVEPPLWIDVPKFAAFSVQPTDDGMRITRVDGHLEYLAEILPGLENPPAGDV
jgi:hypothetical protein